MISTVWSLQGRRLVDRGGNGGREEGGMDGEEEGFPCGVSRRGEVLYFEKRVGSERFYSTKIATPEEGGLCFDILTLHGERLIVSPNGERKKRKKRKASPELNYPDYSPSLVVNVPNVPSTKKKVMEAVLESAQAAVVDLPMQMRAAAAAKGRAKIQKQPAHDVGSCHGIGNRISSARSAGSASRSANKQPDFEKGVQLFDDALERFNGCDRELTLKSIEREELERKVKDIKEDTGIISFQKSGPDKFRGYMAFLRQLFSCGGEFYPVLEIYERKYMSEEAECCKLRKILEGHNLKSIPESLMNDGNNMTGRRRANESERMPRVLENCPIEELNSCDAPPEVSASGGLSANALVVDVMPHGENEVETPAEVCVNNSIDDFSHMEPDSAFNFLHADLPDLSAPTDPESCSLWSPNSIHMNPDSPLMDSEFCSLWPQNSIHMNPDSPLYGSWLDTEMDPAYIHT